MGELAPVILRGGYDQETALPVEMVSAIGCAEMAQENASTAHPLHNRLTGTVTQAIIRWHDTATWAVDADEMGNEQGDA